MIRSYTTAKVLIISIFLLFSLPLIADEAKKDSGGSFLSDLPIEIHGFYDSRIGYRTRNDNYQKDMSIAEDRLQIDLSSYPE